jgi:hypothetical protein
MGELKTQNWVSGAAAAWNYCNNVDFHKTQSKVIDLCHNIILITCMIAIETVNLQIKPLVFAFAKLLASSLPIIFGVVLIASYEHTEKIQIELCNLKFSVDINNKEEKITS